MLPMPASRKATSHTSDRRRRRRAPTVSLRIDLTPDFRLGPGKVRLLELVGDSGSISAAGRALEMSCRRAGMLIEEMNVAFRRPVIETVRGGKRGGGAALTAFGREVIERYRDMQTRAAEAVAPHVRAFAAALART
jgi:molybdate transport system regulatory protein